MEKFTVNTLLDPAIPVSQPETGYRFSIDSILLPAHVTGLKDQQVLDIGTGCGIMSLILARRFPGIHILGIEIQKELAGIARRNVSIHQMEKQITILHDDITRIQPENIQKEIDIIISNPPFQKRGGGRLNKNFQTAVARHELRLTLDELCSACCRLLKPQGKVYLIYPAGRKDELTTVMNQNRLIPDTIRFIHTRKNIPARRILITAIKDGPKSCMVLPPIYIPDAIH